MISLNGRKIQQDTSRESIKWEAVRGMIHVLLAAGIYQPPLLLLL